MDYESVKNVIRTFYHVVAIYSKEFESGEYSFTEAYILEAVGRHPGISAVQFTEMIDINKGYLSRIIKKLVSNGLVRRKRYPGRNGSVGLYLTEKGIALYQEMRSKADESIARHIADAPAKDQAEFLRLMEQLNENLRVVCPEVHKMAQTDL
ncbi:MAG: MarR family transcriptional regulator [Oscillospiraceae bacterium]|nr:MarR family transcriptional regulator [Oscillospiraceae bacterium]